MSVSLGIRLFMMMFLQYAIWGAWTPVLTETLQHDLGFSGTQVAFVYGMLWLACIFSPFIGGQIADRWVPTQWFLAVAHLFGAYALWQAAQQTDPQRLGYWMLAWAVFFAPTLALTNSLAFHHIKSGERDFGIIRVGGTIGWIVAGFGLTAWRLRTGAQVLEGGIDSLLLGAGASLLMAVYSLSLPHTPPNQAADTPLAFTRALKLFTLVPGFAVFMAISLVVTTELQFYYMLSAPFLSDIGIPKAWLSSVKNISQIAEIFAMAIALPILLPRLGMRKTLVIGVLAWPLRYLFFAAGQPLAEVAQTQAQFMVASSLPLHGIGYTFFFVVSQIYVDKVAPKDIRASAQGLLALITLGVGNYLGTQFTGWIQERFTDSTTGVVNWPLVFMVPCALTVACAIAFLLTFKDPPDTVEEEPAPQAGAAEAGAAEPAATPTD